MASVVVAEDNAEHLQVIARILRRLGHEVIETADGRTWSPTSTCRT